MRNLVYYVAQSLDGFIASPSQTTEAFVMEGDHTQDYTAELGRYDTVVMGRGTYEFGYQYGLKPGARAYPHMRHYIFSSTIPFDSNAEVEVVRTGAAEVVSRLKQEKGTDIYLCGGGKLAGFLLEQKLVDKVVVKVNPVVLRDGIRLFEGGYAPRKLALTGTKTYASGVQLLSYDIVR
jgi:dihydrofolate reductase